MFHNRCILIIEFQYISFFFTSIWVSLLLFGIASSIKETLAAFLFIFFYYSYAQNFGFEISLSLNLEIPLKFYVKKIGVFNTDLKNACFSLRNTVYLCKNFTSRFSHTSYTFSGDKNMCRYFQSLRTLVFHSEKFNLSRTSALHITRVFVKECITVVGKGLKVIEGIFGLLHIAWGKTLVKSVIHKHTELCLNAQHGLLSRISKIQLDFLTSFLKPTVAIGLSFVT